MHRLSYKENILNTCNHHLVKKYNLSSHLRTPSVCPVLSIAFSFPIILTFTRITFILVYSCMVYSWCILMFPCPLYFLQIGSWNQGFDYYHISKTIAGGLFFYQEACNALLFFYIHFKINLISTNKAIPYLYLINFAH